MACPLDDLRRHVIWSTLQRSTYFGDVVGILFIDDFRSPKIGYLWLHILVNKNISAFQITMDYVLLMQIY